MTQLELKTEVRKVMLKALAAYEADKKIAYEYMEKHRWQAAQVAQADQQSDKVLKIINDVTNKCRCGF